MMRPLLMGICAIAMTARIADAQDTIVVPLERLEVTITRASQPLTRVPAAVSVVSRTDIQRAQPGIGIEEALAVVPGLVVNNRYNFGLGTRISIRGFGARAAFGVRGIRVFADGVPMTMPDGQANLNNIDLTSTGRIEVMRGAASMLYGNAAGGVVAFESEVPPPGFAVEARAIAGNDDMRRGNLKVGGGSERTRYLINVARLVADGFRRHSDVEQTNLNARVRHELDDRAYLALTFNAADAPVALNPGSLPLDSARLKPEMAWPRNVETRAREVTRQMQLGLEHGRTVGSFDMNAVLYGLTRDLDNPLPFAYITLSRKAGGLRSSISTSRGALFITGGVDVELQSDERSEFNNANGEQGTDQRRDQTDNITNIGPFVRASFDVTPQLTATAGLRYDRTHFDTDDRFLSDNRDDSGELTMSAASPMVGVTYRASRRVNVYASVSTSFQTPTTTELINNPTGTGFNDLDPQRAVSYEAGMRISATRLAGEVSAFHSNVRDALVPFQIAGGDGREFFRNAGRTRQRGIETAIQLLLTRGVRLAASYTWNDFVFVDDGLDNADFNGNQLPGVPPHRLFARLSWSPSWWFVDVEGEHSSSYYAADSNIETSKNPAATVFDVRLGGTQRLGSYSVRPFVGINNLTDEQYFSSVVINAAGARYFETAPGRNIYVGLGLSMGNWP